MRTAKIKDNRFAQGAANEASEVPKGAEKKLHIKKEKT